MATAKWRHAQNQRMRYVHEPVQRYAAEATWQPWQRVPQAHGFATPPFARVCQCGRILFTNFFICMQSKQTLKSHSVHLKKQQKKKHPKVLFL